MIKRITYRSAVLQLYPLVEIEYKPNSNKPFRITDRDTGITIGIGRTAEIAWEVAYRAVVDSDYELFKINNKIGEFATYENV